MALARQKTNYHSLALSLQTNCMEETFYVLKVIKERVVVGAVVLSFINVLYLL